MKRSLLVVVALLTLASCYHGSPGPTSQNDPTQPPFPIAKSPCAGNIDPNCWPFKDAPKGEAPKRFGLLTNLQQPRPLSGVLCQVSNSGAAILTAFGGSCVAPGAGLSIYVTDIVASSTVISSTTADNYLEIKYGTGGTCGTGTTVVWSAYNLAFQPVVSGLTTPIKIPANNELCWMDVVGNKSFVITGFIAP